MSNDDVLFCDGGKYDINKIGYEVALTCLPKEFGDKYQEYIKNKKTNRKEALTE